MRLFTHARWAVPMVAVWIAAGASAAYAQDLPVPQEQAPTARKPKRFSFGIRARDFPIKNFSAMGPKTIETTTYSPQPAPKDWLFSTASKSPFWGAGLAGEFFGGERWTITAEVMYNKVAYTEQTVVYWGVDNPASSFDEREHEFFTENTKGILLDAPVLFHYQPVHSGGRFSKLYVSAGPTFRYAAHVSSFLTTISPSDITTTNSQIVTPSERLVVGGTIGVGFRVVDDFNIKTTPEIRYTRWGGSTFSNQSTVSPRNQLEVGLAFTF